MRRVDLLTSCFVLLAACNERAPVTDRAANAHATERVVSLGNGQNTVDLLGDGTKAQVFVAWRANYNAHGFSTVAFYVLTKSDLSDTSVTWQIIPFFGGSHDGDAGREVYRTSEGADCTLGDLRVLRQEHAPVEVVLASRQPGESLADTAAVRFDYYTLARNTEGLAGWPSHYFQHARTVSAKRAYCDVNEAFQRELGLGMKGLGHGEGGR